jgi:hypothetical protein
MCDITLMNRRHEAPRRIDQPEPGYFAIRLVRKGPRIAAAIELRRGLWCAVINGAPQGWHEDWARAPKVERVWTGERITKTEYDALLALAGIQGHPASTPTKPIDLGSLPPLY